MPSESQKVEVKLRGTVRANFWLQGQASLSFLTEGWSDEEKQDLIDRDPEAIDALKSALWSTTVAAPDDFETEHFELVIEKEATDA